ncbi:MAG: hypothetical protein H7Z13_17165 [Ferruginibacter sp.]|nr:hypothetical protein [Ferruginibacter sp.]
MPKKRDIKVVANFVSYKEAEQNDNLYYSKLSAEDLLKECFDLRRLNYFNGKINNLPRIEKIGIISKREDHEKHNA